MGLEQRVGGGVGVEFPGSDAPGEPIQLTADADAGPAASQLGHGDGLDLHPGTAGASGEQFAALGEEGVVPLDLGDDLVEALLSGGADLQDRLAPGTVTALGEVEHAAQVAAHLIGAVAVGLVDDVEVADLEDAGLRRLDAVAHPRGEEDDRGVGLAGDLDLALADADGLDQDDVEPETAVLDSPFDYARQAVFAIPTDVPVPVDQEPVRAAHQKLGFALQDTISDLDVLQRAGETKADEALTRLRMFLMPTIINHVTAISVGGGMVGRG